MTANTESNDFAIEEVVQQLNACATMPSDLIEIFSEEAEEHLQKIYQGMGRLKENPGDQDALGCLLYTSPSPRDLSTSRMPSSA